MTRRRVVLESPYANGIDRNVEYAKACIHDCLCRGEAPIASHLLYTQVLDDCIPEERTLGITAGHAWIPAADAVVVYIDYGISHGMMQGIAMAALHGVAVERRRLENKFTDDSPPKSVPWLGNLNQKSEALFRMFHKEVE